MIQQAPLNRQVVGLVLISSAISLLAAMPDAKGQETFEFREMPDPINILHSAELRDGAVVQSTSQSLPESVFVNGLDPLPPSGAFEKFEERRTIAKPEKIHPELRARISPQISAFGRPPDLETVVVTFKSDVQMPRFPEPNVDERPTSVFNRAARNRAQDIVEEMTLARLEAQNALAEDLAANFGADLHHRFWLSNSLQVTLPADKIDALAKRDDVLYIEPDLTEASPPADGNNFNDVDDGRARIVSDPYFDLPNVRTGGFIGLLDTGVRTSHVLFNNPDHISFHLDCTDGVCDRAPNPDDDCWNHGTSTAAIITGNNRLGNPFRGVTAGTLDSFKVYPAGCGGLSTTAVLAAFERSVALLDRVIVAEMQGGGSDRSAISIAADNAFDAGAVIIAANGNFGPGSGTVNTPANSHKSIGVGNFDVQTQNQITSQSRGPAPDGRIKPDIQAPTNTETASTASNTALQVFGGTSGATPYAAGAAFLARNFLRGASGSIDPGQVYAFLILAGQNPFPFNNTSGAGPLEMPTGGQAWWGKVEVSDGQTVTIPIQHSMTAATAFDAAIWWPESVEQIHNDIDLQLVSSNGITVLDRSISGPSVFERAGATGAISPGTWGLRISGFRVGDEPQVVYYAAHIN